MGSLNVSDRTIKKYFAFLNKLDNSSKSKLIKRLKGSLTLATKEHHSISDLYGKWDDKISVEEQITEIRNSRVDSTSDLNFE